MAVIFPIKVGLFVRANSPIKTIKDMKGKTVSYGYTSQEIIKLTVDAMLATEGLTAADLKTVLVPNLVRGVDELMSGRVDITTFAIGSAKVSEADARSASVSSRCRTRRKRWPQCRRCSAPPTSRRSSRHRTLPA